MLVIAGACGDSKILDLVEDWSLAIVYSFAKLGLAWASQAWVGWLSLAWLGEKNRL